MVKNIFIFVSAVLTVLLHQRSDGRHKNNFVTYIHYIHKREHWGKYLTVRFLLYFVEAVYNIISLCMHVCACSKGENGRVFWTPSLLVNNRPFLLLITRTWTFMSEIPPFSKLICLLDKIKKNKKGNWHFIHAD